RAWLEVVAFRICPVHLMYLVPKARAVKAEVKHLRAEVKRLKAEVKRLRAEAKRLKAVSLVALKM
ncbi:MAG: hypothetical protein PUE99_08215, partial [Anaerovibrio sp.]|nr:hypothetical protein [Anaerovibrio sp.]